MQKQSTLVLIWLVVRTVYLLSYYCDPEITPCSMYIDVNLGLVRKVIVDSRGTTAISCAYFPLVARAARICSRSLL